ncbi:hypothetical protein DFQ00_114135 [Paenibacillus barcinonensis]|uniref:Uncharacterized protein n=1 Tax=Paenibacillus barcinonensis TaxID=198119 RepID=A0A2V4V527_PAEBA|nr:hypothetical protein [Paenibacillus barcinonensis]PYE47393.1 hypothetical protein DFQ00_114135 [Paenibacillus barcinonensis]
MIVGYMLGLLAYGPYASGADNGVMSSKQTEEHSVQYMLERLESGVTLKELAAQNPAFLPISRFYRLDRQADQLRVGVQ